MQKISKPVKTKKKPKNLETVIARIDSKLKSKLKKISKSRDLTISEIVQQSIELFIERARQEKNSKMGDE